MCDVTNLDYLNDQLRQLDGIKNVLEVGSYDVNGNCRASVTENGSSYVGVDIQQGPNVDRIVDITDEAAVSNKALPEAPFDLVICMNVLEHLYRPITAMDNMCGLLKEGGYILISVPLIVIPQRFRKGFFDFFLKVLGKKIVPGLYECWPHISLYVICRKLP